MAKISKGILGGFSGKVGPVVGVNWRGNDLMRSRPKKSNRPATESQAEQRARFGMAIKLLSPIKGILGTYYGQPAEDRSRANLAVSYHIMEGITGTYPALEFDYEKFVLTKGELLGAEDLESELAADAKISFEWTNNSGQGMALAQDNLLVVVYNETRNLWEYRQSGLRSDLAFAFDLPDNWQGNTVHCWVSFTSDARKLCATSQYKGPFVLL